MKYARIVNGKVHEICVPVEGFTIDECFHPDLVAQMVACTDDVKHGWSYADGVFTAPQEQTTDTTTTSPAE
jgi:hypothetical protein